MKPLKKRLITIEKYIWEVRKNLQMYNSMSERLVKRITELERKRCKLVYQIEKEKEKNA